MADAFSVSLTSLAEAVRGLFGVDAAYRPLNDVEVFGRKLIASSARLESDVLTMRMLLNVSPVNRHAFAGAIRTPPEKMADKRITDPVGRVTCLESETGHFIGDQELVRLTEDAVRRIFGEEVRLQVGELSDLERAYARRYHREHISPDWFYANSERGRFNAAPAGAVKGEGLHKAPAGLIRVTLLALGGQIHDLIITGDFHPRPYGIVAEMENAIRGLDLSMALVTERIGAIMGRGDVEIPGTEPKDFLAAFSKALDRLQPA
jgi:lipoate-protein ligase A